MSGHDVTPALYSKYKNPARITKSFDVTLLRNIKGFFFNPAAMACAADGSCNHAIVSGLFY